MPWSRRDCAPAPPVAQIREARDQPARQRGPGAAGKNLTPLDSAKNHFFRAPDHAAITPAAPR